MKVKYSNENHFCDICNGIIPSFFENYIINFCENVIKDLYYNCYFDNRYNKYDFLVCKDCRKKYKIRVKNYRKSIKIPEYLPREQYKKYLKKVILDK